MRLWDSVPECYNLSKRSGTSASCSSLVASSNRLRVYGGAVHVLEGSSGYRINGYGDSKVAALPHSPIIKTEKAGDGA